MSHTKQIIQQIFAMESLGTVVRIHGDATRVMPYIRLGSTIAVESAQQESDEAKKKAIMDVFVVVPQQTGLQAQLELTKSAIQNPEATSVLFVEPETELSPEEQNELDVLKAFVADGGAAVFTEAEECGDYVTQTVSAQVD